MITEENFNVLIKKKKKSFWKEQQCRRFPDFNQLNPNSNASFLSKLYRQFISQLLYCERWMHFLFIRNNVDFNHVECLQKGNHRIKTIKTRDFLYYVLPSETTNFQLSRNHGIFWKIKYIKLEFPVVNKVLFVYLCTNTSIFQAKFAYKWLHCTPVEKYLFATIL